MWCQQVHSGVRWGALAPLASRSGPVPSHYLLSAPAILHTHALPLQDASKLSQRNYKTTIGHACTLSPCCEHLLHTVQRAQSLLCGT